MSSNTSSAPELSCDDSPLSITSNIIGILTLAYAIFITLVYWAKDRRESNALADRIVDEARAVAFRSELLENRASDVPEEFRASLTQLSDEVDESISAIRKDLDKIGKRPFVNYKPLILDTLEHSRQLKTHLDGAHRAVENSIILNELKEQRTIIQQQAGMITSQGEMLKQILASLQLDVPPSTTEQDEDMNTRRDFLPVYLSSLQRHNSQRRNDTV